MSYRSLLLWDGTKSTPSEQLTNPDSYIGTDSAGEIGAFPIPVLPSLPTGTYYGNDGGGAMAVQPKVLPTKIYVGQCEPSTVQYGSIDAPFADLPDALSYLAGRGEPVAEIHISPGSYGGGDLPAAKTISIIAEAGAILGQLRLTADGSQESKLRGRGLTIQSIDTNSPGSSTDQYEVRLEDCDIVEGVTNSGGCDLRLVFDRVYVTKEIQSNYLTATDSEFGQTITTELVKATRCIFPESLKLGGLRAEMYGCSFPFALTTITMTNGVGTERVFFDQESAVSFATSDGDIAGGEPESQQNGPWLVRTDDTFVEGQCAYMRTPILVRRCVGNTLETSIMVGIVSPAQPTANRMALVWGSGRVPVSGFPDRTLYRDDAGMPVPFSSIPAGRYTQRVGQCDGEAIYLQIGEEIMA